MARLKTKPIYDKIYALEHDLNQRTSVLFTLFYYVAHGDSQAALRLANEVLEMGIMKPKRFVTKDGGGDHDH